MLEGFVVTHIVYILLILKPQGSSICVQCKIPSRESMVLISSASPLQYSSLGNVMDRRAWWGIIYGVAKESDMIQ